jgi:segregation and condensation protein A
MQQKVFDLLLEQEEVSWKSILFDLVKSEEMNPWDINVTLLTQKYIKAIKKMQEHDLRVSGKILLAAAYLLKMKSAHLINNDFAKLDELMNPEEIEEEFFDDLPQSERKIREKYQLIPKQPQPRNRKVSILDLVSALQQAMASKKRILAKSRPVKYILPKKGIDIMGVIKDMYHKITYYSNKDKSTKLSFTKLLPPRAGKKEKVYTFIPLLHLENENKIETSQAKAFDEIYVKMLKGSKTN